MNPQIADTLLNGARDELERSHNIMPKAFFFHGEKFFLILAMPYDNDEEKCRQMFITGAIARKLTADAVYLVTDCAMRQCKTSEQAQYIMENLATEAPLCYPPSQRQDALLCHGVDFVNKAQTTIVWLYKEHEGLYMFNKKEAWDGTDGMIPDLLKAGYKEMNLAIHDGVFSEGTAGLEQIIAKV